jgi:hypothetical protein
MTVDELSGLLNPTRAAKKMKKVDVYQQVRVGTAKDTKV